MKSFLCFCLYVFASFYTETAAGQPSRRQSKTSIAYRNNYQRMAGGRNHTLEIRNGTLWAWGANGFGQLGTGATTHSNVPIQVGTDNRWVSMAGGGYHSLGLKSDGTLWAWGSNGDGQLGNGTADLNAHSVPVQVGTDNRWVSVVAGVYHSLGLKSDGTLWAWGSNDNGELGTGTTTHSNMPVQVGTDNRWVSVAGGGNHNLGLKSNGTLWAWGDNSVGQLGNSTTTDSNMPIQVGTDNRWVSVAGGYLQSLGLKSDGTLWAWGYNNYGELGNGTNTNSNVPIQVGTDNRWVSMSGRGLHSLGLKSDGTLWAWGDNAYGQLGNGTTTDSNTPVQVGADNKWVSVAGGGFHSLGLKSDGTLWAWGDNAYGQLGNNTASHTPVQVGADNKWVSVAAGYTHSLGLKSDGTLWAWGDNSEGQLGNGTADYNPHPTPMQVGADNKWVSVAAGGYHSLGLKSDGTLWAWGDNAYGQLGNNTASRTPVQVGADNKWVSVAGGFYHSLGLKSNGSLWAWGDNGSGQLGTGTTTDSNTPMQAESDVVAMAAGGRHSVLVHSNRNSLCLTGSNTSGQLGDGTTTNKSVFTCLLVTYFPRTNATDLSQVSNWTVNPSGTGGASPLDFTSPYQTFFLSNTVTNPVVAGPWTISGGSNLALNNSNALTFAPTASLTIGTGSQAQFGGRPVTLKSTPAGTAYIGQVTGTLSGATNITVERYISSGNNRAYRLLAPSVTTATSIHQNWQEGATGAAHNPRPGYGTHITGTTADQANGFDATLTGQGSLFTLNATNNSWVYIANTDVNTLEAKTGYLLYIRGDRSVDLNATALPLPSSHTTLRATGSLLTGNQTFPNLNGAASAGLGFNLIANPYAAPLSWPSLRSDNSTVLAPAYTLWDPNIAPRAAT